MRAVFGRLFGLKTPVDRRTYLVTGVSLMLFKYFVDALAIWKFAGVDWTPWNYLTAAALTGSAASRISLFPLGLDIWLLVWTLIFVWIGVSMTLRRAVDAGKSPWLSLWFFVPWVNYLVMLYLAAVPSVP